MKVAVLLNHYEAHQVPHVVPYAFDLSILRPDWTVKILCSSDSEFDFAQKIATLFPGHNCHIEMLKLSFLAKCLDPLARQVGFYKKKAIQQENLKEFANFDALIVPEMTSLALHHHKETAHVKLIFTGHGVGVSNNREFGMFDPRLDNFDLVLLQGEKMATELRDMGRLQNTPYAITGYPKLELEFSTKKTFFHNNRKTVIYNPTQKKGNTSWHKFGRSVLDYFYASKDYNLIFAPHTLLFKRPLFKGASFPKRYKSTDHVRIDLGSSYSTDMTYLNSADIYLGDMSSQVFEFIARPRPCVFIDAIGVDEEQRQNFQTWSFGPVIDDVNNLEKALQESVQNFEHYRPFQETTFNHNFFRSEKSASSRGAKVIAEFLETGNVSDKWH